MTSSVLSLTVSAPSMMTSLKLIVTMSLLWSSVTSTSALSPTGLQLDYCQWEKFTASCGSDSVVVMETALYGRMKHTRCIKYNLGYIGCTADVLDIADMSCSGRRKCEITVPNESLDNAKTCLAELTCYLSASYRCQKVITADPFMCRSTNLVKVLPVSGFISNLVPGSRVSPADCGGDASPQWLIEAQPGQRINITLWDFARRRIDKQSQHQSSLPGCIKYATLTEDGPEVSTVPARSKPVCGSNGLDPGRVTWIYESTSSALQVKMYTLATTDGATGQDAPHFLLEYHIIGCADLQVPDQAWFQRDGITTARIGCGSPSSGEKFWTLTCNGSTWVGNTQSVITCQSQPESNLQVLNNFRFPIASSVVVIISLSLLIGFIILIIGLLYLCRRWRRHAADNVEVSAVCRGTAETHSDVNYVSGSSRLLVQQKACGQLSMNIQDQRSVEDNMMPSNRQVHRESNEYASIWEWPLPNTPATGGDSTLPVGCGGTNRPDYEMSGSRDIHGYYGTYETRQFNSSLAELSCRRVEHPYQHPGTPSSGRRCFVKDDVITDKSAGRPRYFELNTGLAQDNSSGCVVDAVTSGTTGGGMGQIMSVHAARMPCYSQQYIVAKPSHASKSSLTILN